MEFSFQKMHGTLNDFVVLHDLVGKVSLSPEQVKQLCRRHAGVGADGLIVVRSSKVADFFMDYSNADGSLAEMCGNGIRCLAKYVYDNGLSEKTALSVETRAGTKTVELFPGEDGRIQAVRVDMGRPIFDPERIPANIPWEGKPVLDYPITVEGRVFLCSVVSMGNPHCVILADMEEDIERLSREYGPTLETHPAFPARTNVEFIQVLSRTRIKMRVWERGSGETYACGTGACASAVVTILKGLTDPDTTVELKGGDLAVYWNSNDNPVLMSGPSVTVFKGTTTI